MEESTTLTLGAGETKGATAAEHKATAQDSSLPKPGIKKANTAASDASSGLDDYFVGPRDMNKHSKWPIFLRLHGSITPEMILPLLFVAAWSTLITCISRLVHPLGISSLLLTVLGFVVGLALSFRSSTAYERYNDGRKYWAQLTLVSQSLARLIWIHADERHGTLDSATGADIGQHDLLCKITALNLISTFAVALKHRLRFEPFTDYNDFHHVIGHLDLFANQAESKRPTKKHVFKVTGEFLGVPMAESNPRKLIKDPSQPLGNLPLEILSHLSSYVRDLFDNGTFKVSIYQTQAMNSLQSMNDVLTGTERVLNTPLPIAYSIAIGQITWVYILLLPFQLVSALQWITIPGSIFAAYVILGLALIGREIENPFGNDVNDLPLDGFARQIREDMDLIMSKPRPSTDAWVRNEHNRPLYPLSLLGYEAWKAKGTDELREALMYKPSLAVKREDAEGLRQRYAQEHDADGTAAGHTV